MLSLFSSPFSFHFFYRLNSFGVTDCMPQRGWRINGLDVVLRDVAISIVSCVKEKGAGGEETIESDEVINTCTILTIHPVTPPHPNSDPDMD